MDDSKGSTRLTWLKQRAIAHSPDAILTTLEKITFLQQTGVANWDLSLLNPNRLKILNRLGKCSSNQALQRSSPERRYPILVAFMHQALEALIDEAVDLFDQCLTRSYSRSKNRLKQHHEHVRETTNEKIRLFSLMGRIILNENIPDADLRNALYHQISSDTLRRAMDECDTLMRPENDKYLDYFAKRFSYLRQFTPDFIAQCDFQSQQENHPVLQAVDLLNETNKTASRKIPDSAPTNFISGAWKQYVFQSGKIDRKYYELCTLWALRNVLRSGDIWVDGGRRYNNPEHYLIPRSQWPDIKQSACELLQLSPLASVRLQARQKELHQLFDQLNTQILKDDKLRIEDGSLIITPLEAADESASLKKLRQLMTDHLPKIDFPELVVEVDDWIHFSECFYVEGNQRLNPKEFPIYFYGAFLAEAMNLGSMAMSGITNLNYERLVWHNHWLIRDETLDATRVKLVNFMHNLALAQHFGDGRFSSSDGRRVPVAVKTTTAGYFVKYFAFETGLNLYSWTSDQYPQYGNTVTSPTMRESTFVLDAILDNETELQIERHTTDTGGYTEIIFALFDLLGLRFEPRIKNLGDQRLYAIAQKEVYANIDEIITGNANAKLIEDNWDDMLRLSASLKKIPS